MAWITSLFKAQLHFHRAQVAITKAARSSSSQWSFFRSELAHKKPRTKQGVGVHGSVDECSCHRRSFPDGAASVCTHLCHPCCFPESPKLWSISYLPYHSLPPAKCKRTFSNMEFAFTVFCFVPGVIFPGGGRDATAHEFHSDVDCQEPAPGHRQRWYLANLGLEDGMPQRFAIIWGVHLCSADHESNGTHRIAKLFLASHGISGWPRRLYLPCRRSAHNSLGFGQYRRECHSRWHEHMWLQSHLPHSPSFVNWKWLRPLDALLSCPACCRNGELFDLWCFCESRLVESSWGIGSKLPSDWPLFRRGDLSQCDPKTRRLCRQWCHRTSTFYCHRPGRE